MKSLFLFLFLPLLANAAEIREEAVTYADAKFRIARIPAADLEIIWKNNAGEIYRTFDKVQADLTRQGRKVRFLMNAGIFEPGGIPSGIHIEAGKPLLPLNPKDGKGNFFLKPNGVVSYWTGRDGGAEISTLEGWNLRTEMARKVRDHRTPEFAAQSGPLLLMGGRRHPAFKQGSENKLHRNGIGVDKAGNFVCVITVSGQVVNFWDFAGLFLHLGCEDALFLDGDISQMTVNPSGPVESNFFGAMFIVAD